MEPFDHALDRPDDRTVRQVEGDVHLGSRAVAVRGPCAAEGLPDGLADVGTQGEQFWPEICCEESVGRRNPVVAVLVHEPLDVSEALGGESAL